MSAEHVHQPPDPGGHSVLPGHHGAHEIDIDRHVRIYITVFVSLLVLTLVTVGISYLHLPLLPAVVLALTVATIKGSLVACYFMHLISERKLIYAVMVLTVLFFFFVLIGPMLTENDQVGTETFKPGITADMGHGGGAAEGAAHGEADPGGETAPAEAEPGH